jgi:arsenical pump membrane protein
MSGLSAALRQSWPPFALILGLLLVGLLANKDGLFAWGGSQLRRLPGGPTTLLASALALVCVVTAILNLDTAVVFLTPVLIAAAADRELAVEPFLYGCVFMANASSLFLPGSNLTNLLVLSHEHLSGSQFAIRILPEAVAAAGVTAVGVLLLFRRNLSASRGPRPTSATVCAPRPGLGLGVLTTVLVTVLVIVLREPAAPVLAVGLIATAISILRGRLGVGEAVRVVGPLSLSLAFALTVALGVLAREWAGPAELLAGANGWQTAALAALTAILINNLPAAALYSAHAVGHPQMLLLGLNVGPNLAVTGALSALLWHRTATQAGVRPSIRTFSRYGVILAPAAMAAGVLVGRG